MITGNVVSRVIFAMGLMQATSLWGAGMTYDTGYPNVEGSTCTLKLMGDYDCGAGKHATSGAAIHITGPGSFSANFNCPIYPNGPESQTGQWKGMGEGQPCTFHFDKELSATIDATIQCGNNASISINSGFNIDCDSETFIDLDSESPALENAGEMCHVLASGSFTCNDGEAPEAVYLSVKRASDDLALSAGECGFESESWGSWGGVGSPTTTQCSVFFPHSSQAMDIKVRATLYCDQSIPSYANSAWAPITVPADCDVK